MKLFIKISLFSIFTLIITFNSLAQNCNTQKTDKRRKQICECEMKPPNSYIVQITMNRGIKNYNGTAFFIHPRVLLTAGHNLRKKPFFIYPRVKSIILRFAATDQFHFLDSDTLSVSSENIYTLDSFNKKYSVSNDYGIIILPDSSAWNKIKGNFNLGIYSNKALQNKFIYIAGYPGDKPFCTQWQDSSSNFKIIDNVLKYDFKTEHGLSGAPVWYINKNNEKIIIAVHTNGQKYGCTTATIITQEIYDDIVKFCSTKNIELQNK